LDDIFAGLGGTYTNTTGMHEKMVFTGSDQFEGKEIEVIAITNRTDQFEGKEIVIFLSFDISVF
jgi:hypothetical protein